MLGASGGLGTRAGEKIILMDNMIRGLDECGESFFNFVPGPVAWLNRNFSSEDLEEFGGSEGLFCWVIEDVVAEKRNYFYKVCDKKLDTAIPRFLPDFLESVAFPFAQRIFSMAVSEVGSDDKYKEYLSFDKALGSKDLWGILDSGQEFFFNFFKNLFHEFHHNIINPNAWSRFLDLGTIGDNYD